MYNIRTKRTCRQRRSRRNSGTSLMPTSQKKPFDRPLGYPSEARVLQACATIAANTPDVVHRTCCVKLHNPSQRKRAALLDVFSNNTLAAAWMLRDIEARDPLHRFGKFRKRNSASYYSKGIQDCLDKEYRSEVRARYALNSN